MEHEPCGLLSDFDSAVNLPRANPVLAIRDHPHSSQPFVETEWRIFKDRPSLDGKLSAIMTIIALPTVVLFLKGYVLASTTRADDALTPTADYNVVAAIGGTGEVNDCFLKGRGFHRS